MKENKKKYYVYYLIDPRNDKVFYVGKGKNQRMYQHEQQVRKGCEPREMNKKLYYKIKKIHSEHYKIKYQKVFFTDNEDEAYQIEEQHQRKFGLEKLCNIIYGTPFSSIYNSYRKGKTLIEIYGKEKAAIRNKKFSEKMKGRKGPMKGKKFSEEHKRKISMALKGKTFEEMYGEEEAKRKKKAISNSLKDNIPWNKGLTSETDERVKENTKKRNNFDRSFMKTNEYRKKMSDSIKKHWVKRKNK